MPPLWGFGYLVCRVFYKHAAPLGLKAESNLLVTLGLCLGFLIRVIRAIRVIGDSDKKSPSGAECV